MGTDADARYRAFISYSHVDQAFGRRLHRRLERYGLPGRLVGRTTSRGPVPRRVAPVFRDREEVTAGQYLYEIPIIVDPDVPELGEPRFP